jgi:hypothetical protein
MPQYSSIKDRRREQFITVLKNKPHFYLTHTLFFIWLYLSAKEELAIILN